MPPLADFSCLTIRPTRHFYIFPLIAMKIILPILAALAFVLSCQQNSIVGSGPDFPVALPLEEGNMWEYQRLTFDSNGAVTDSSTIVMSVASPDTFGTEIGHRLNNFLFTITFPGVILWANKSDGVYRILGNPLDPSTPVDVQRALPFPTFPGDSLVFGGYTIRTQSLDESVAVISGSFTCVRYDVFTNASLVGQISVVPDLGIVKTWQRFGYSTVVDELRSFSLRN